MSNIACFVLIVILFAGYIYIMKGLSALLYLELDYDGDKIYRRGGGSYLDGDDDDDDCDFDFDFD